MKSIFVFFQRRPQSKLAVVRLLLYVVFAVVAKTALDMNTLYILLAGVLGVADLAGTSVANGQTTPVNDPRLGTGAPPPELVVAAEAVSAFLPAPIGDIFTRFGAEGAWAVVQAAQKAAGRALTPEEGAQRVKDEVANRG